MVDKRHAVVPCDTAGGVRRWAEKRRSLFPRVANCSLAVQLSRHGVRPHMKWTASFAGELPGFSLHARTETSRSVYERACRLTTPRIRHSIPGLGQGILLFSIASSPVLGLTEPTSPMATGGISVSQSVSQLEMGGCNISFS